MSVTLQRIPQEPSAANLTDVNEFFVPTILSFNLKKTSEDRPPTVEADNLGSLQNGDLVTEENEELKMSPRKKENTPLHRKHTSSFLLEPFLKPVGTNIESNKENPVLKALFGGRSPTGLPQWSYMTRTSLNNCHPFKKTEFSHDFASDSSPAQVPKSLLKKPSKHRKSFVRKESPREPTEPAQPAEPPETPETPEPPETPEAKTTVLKEVQMKSDTSTISVSTLSVSDNLINVPTSPKRTSTELSVFSKRKKVVSQINLTTPKPRLQYVNSERLMQLRTIVDNAIKNHKVYSMTGCYNSVRNALKQRGWIEKIDSEVKGRRKINKFQDIGLCQGEAEIMNRMLRNVTEDLCWLSRPYPYYCLKDFDKFEMVNRLPRAYFSNKVGLCTSLQQIQWFYETGVCSTQFPRTYNMSMKDEIDAFKDDYRLTASICTLKWFLHTYKTGGEAAVRAPDGKVDMNVIEFALRRCAEFVKTKQHEDIDIIDAQTVWDYQWDQFIIQYYKIVNDGQVLKDNKEGISIKTIVSNVQSMLNILKPYWPQYDIEGYQNFWIVKPGGRCCGAGIVIKNNLDQILAMVHPNSMRETRFVVQKYIERPLLIYNTKFDIRQWFLVTNVYPLTIWMYKESYLRFCSQPFTLKNTHESIHLCNNAVQRKYKNGKRDRGLPEENMWDCYTFQTYLKAIGHPDVWDKYIYPGMRESFIGALLASQDTMERKKNCFELYGADFMISDSLTDGPWLIEINSNPAMDSSTSVTARMCPQVLEDIIKVVIDRRDNKSASTGAFEMVFKQNCPPIPPYLGMSLCIKGKKACRASGDIRSSSRKSKNKSSTEQLYHTDTEEESVVEETVKVTQPSIEAEKQEGNSSDEGISRRTSSIISQSNDKIKMKESKKDLRCIIKHRKVDWVRKNIEDLRAFNDYKNGKASKESSPSQVTSNMEMVFRDQVLNFLGTVDVKEFVHEILKLKKQMKDQTPREKTSNELLVGGNEITKKNDNWNVEDLAASYGISDNLKERLLKILENCQKTGEKTTSDEKLEEICAPCPRIGIRSCPNFDSTFEAELRKVDASEEKSAGKESENSIESYVTVKTCPSGSSKSSLEYFREWRSKLYETRRTCEDMLSKLQQFQEENSKVKFQNAVKKRMKDEVDFIKRIRQYRKSKRSGREKSSRKEHRDFLEGRDKVKLDDGRSTTSSTWNCDGDDHLTLAINSETGAVRNINVGLPKIKQRSRPLLPNGSSGHGRKIDATLESTCCH